MHRFLDLEAAVGRRLEIVHLFQAWGSPDTAAFRPEWIEPATSEGRRVLLTWEPWAPGAGAVQPEYAPDLIVAGRHDAYIEAWGTALADIRGTVWLRPMHEMNGNWYPWAGGLTGITPERFVAAWRHLHRVVRDLGATNVRWVWAPNSPDVPAGNRFERYYPGDSYVDVLGLDGYNWGAAMPENGGWRGVEDVFAADLARLRTLGPQPVWITETGASPDGGSKAGWVRDLITMATSDPRIEAVVWFDVLKERDWRLTGEPAVARAFGQPGNSRA
jgi:beta-mannanase